MQPERSAGATTDATYEPLMTPSHTTLFVVLALAGTAADPLPRKHTNLQRLSPDRLAATHADVQKLAARRATSSTAGGAASRTACCSSPARR